MEVIIIDKILGKKEAAQLLGISIQTLDRLRKNGLPSHRIGGKIKFHEDEIMEWFKKQK